MKLDRAQNVNTQAYWDARYRTGNYVPSIASVENFFSFGFLPSDEEISILDIGCGQADHYKAIHPKHPKAKLTGADISLFACNYNKLRFKFANFIHLDIERDSLPEKFDFIISSHTFEHLTDPVAALNKCRRHANKGVVICVPYKDSWSYDHEHMHTFSETEPFTDHSYYLIEYHVPHKVGGISYLFPPLS